MSLLLDEKDAQTAYEEGTDSDRALLKRLYPSFFNKKITDRINGLDDVLSINGIDRHKRMVLWATLQDIPHLMYFDQACLIAEAYNEGWTPDWDNTNEYKYYAWWYMNKGASGSAFRFGSCNFGSHASTVGSRLVFRTEELARDAAKKFKDVYEGYMVIK